MTHHVRGVFQLEKEFVHLENNGHMKSLLVDEKFWSDDSQHGYLRSGRLMGVLKLDPSPSHWEVHPDGDELLYLLSGSMDVVLKVERKNKVVTLDGLSSFIVPKGMWHQTIARETSTLLFITPSKDTQRRDR
jgi:mannose-6-phosphate isomerase-like protein (cupin superfamily)